MVGEILSTFSLLIGITVFIVFIGGEIYQKVKTNRMIKKALKLLKEEDPDLEMIKKQIGDIPMSEYVTNERIRERVDDILCEIKQLEKRLIIDLDEVRIFIIRRIKGKVDSELLKELDEVFDKIWKIITLESEVEHYLDKLKDPNDEERLRSVWALGELGNPQVIESLKLTAEKDKDPVVRSNALYSLQRLQAKEDI